MIRLKNLDLESEGMKRHTDVILGDVTASRIQQIFVAPIDCVVETVDIYNSDSQAITTSPNLSLFIATATASLLAADHTSTLTMGARIRFTPSANNSLTAGTRLALSFNISGSSNFSAAICHVKYKPLKHRTNS
jgi:hypothetical protein